MVRVLRHARGMTTESMPLPATPSEPERSAKVEPRAKPAAAGGYPQTAGTLWFAGWLFTIGFAKLVWWKALLGIVLWPYFLGTTIR